MLSVRSQLVRVAAAHGPVLVCGESGTGKELVARLVHELSPRAAGPLVAVDCGAIAETLLESELFGHARGAFTGAAGERRGLFEAADGGTLFLDEIANTSLAFQARLLRVLQEREVRRVGATQVRRVDVRVVAASNQDLAAEAHAGRFRQDLLYRLDVLPLRLPPLRERRADVPEIARCVLARLGERDGRPIGLTSAAAMALLSHDWPGNVRELANVLERAAAYADGPVDVEHLPDHLARRVARRDGRSLLSALMAGFEGAVLSERLRANDWNRTATAAELGITRRCLFTKIAKHGLEPPAARLG